MKKRILSETPFGPIVIYWDTLGTLPKIEKIILSSPEESALIKEKNYSKISEGTCTLIDDIALKIQDKLHGHDIIFSLNSINLKVCSPFQQKVLKAEHAIPAGKVSTYQLIGQHIGQVRGARAVGNALASNPFPIIIPCHRAIRTDLNPGGYQGGLKMKQRLLEQEGIQFDRKGHVITDQLFYQK